ncbi:PAS domain-containing protein [Elioraea sp.]|uniref:PAS domain-containing protein n=1 Tax=Elioraea sp. TaxID=2185103 RepID=UPI0025B7DC11|nr:PAS domain-containing protein [Elioraea sp.]
MQAANRPPARPNLHSVLEHVGALFPGHAMRRLRLPDGTFRYTYASPHLRQSFGLDVAAIVAQRPAEHEWIHPDDRERFVAALHRSADELSPFDEEVRVLTPDGGVRWVRSMSQPACLADGTIAWDGIALDVTERREATAALERAVALARAAEARSFRPGPPLEPDLIGAIADAARVLAGEVRTRRGKEAAERLRSLLASIPADQPAPPLALAPLIAALSPRRRAVAALLAEGLSNRDIGLRLGITEGTAKLHVTAVLRHLGVTRRAAVAALLAKASAR